MIYLLIVIYMLLLPITILAMLYTIITMLEKMQDRQEEQTKTGNKSVLSKRRHTNIKKSDYANVFNNRNKYKDYETNKGLYEPVTPHKGVAIKKEV